MKVVDVNRFKFQQSLLIRMNTGQLRKVTNPQTPNFEDMKQKGKSKSRRKPYSIPPTNPPTPKPHKAQIMIKTNNDKFSDNMRNKQEVPRCSAHPDRVATHPIENSNKLWCSKCYIMRSKSDEDCDQQIQIQKKNDLDEFKERIKCFGLKLQQASSAYGEWSHQSDQNFYYQKDYISETFQKMKCMVQQKKRQLINQLMKKQQTIKKSLNIKNQLLQQIKSSINRYIEDINNNYEDIIQSLSYKQFNQIIERYNQKINYFQYKLQDITFQTTINAYIPETQIKKYIEISEVQIYPNQQQQNCIKNKTLQRYTTQKNNLMPDYQFQIKPHNHHQSLNNKYSQHRKSRDREYFSKQTPISQLRTFANKQNYYYDNGLYR